MNKKNLIFLLFAFLAIVAVASSFSLVEVLDADQVMVVQYPNGTLALFTTPGPHLQLFGAVTKYPRRGQFWFSKSAEQGEETDQSISIRFNDRAKAKLSGSLSYEVPFNSYEQMIFVHTSFGSPEALEHQLIRTTVEKSIYMTGPLMSSTESNAEKRNDLLNFIDDQLVHGVYKTNTRTITDKDPMTGAPRTVAIVELQKDSTGNYARQDESPIAKFHVVIYGLSINAVDYDKSVEEQNQRQQQALQQVQLAIAKSKEAEQNAITAEKEGQAQAATAKWEQEVIKAREVTQAQQRLEVERLSVQTAEQYKKKRTLEGEGEGSYQAAVMKANGALQQKLDAWIKVNESYAEAIKGYTGAWVPGVVMGNSSGSTSANGAQALIDLLTAKTANDLNLQFKVK